MEVLPLGAGGEVGRSCVQLACMGRKVMFDCGVHPGMSGVASLPYFDAVELSEVDALLVTHFHIDHCAAVPYLVSKTDFKGRVLMTHPTKAIFQMLMHDFTRGGKGSDQEPLFKEEDLSKAVDKIEAVDFDQEVDINGMKVTPYRAGHVLGACMFLVDIGGFKALYTGDYSRKPDRHLPGAELPPVSPDLVMIESTFGISTLRPRQEREEEFCTKVHSIIKRGGKVLLPVVALGRAQEMMLVLDEYWRKNKELQDVPVYNASALARRSLAIYQTYVNMLSDEVKASGAPLKLRYVQPLPRGADLDESGPCVVFATPSMLQDGLSRDLFEQWCDSEQNGAVISDFAVPGTLARELLGNPSEIVTRSGSKVPLKMSVDAISFSAHADYPQTQSFLDALNPSNVALVHGENPHVGRLQEALSQKAESDGKQMAVWTPKNCQPVLLTHRAEKVGRVVGSLAEQGATPGSRLAGLLVRKDFSDMLMDQSDLRAFTKLSTGTVRHRQRVPCSLPLSQCRSALSKLFARIDSVPTGPEEGEGKGDESSISVEGLVEVRAGDSDVSEEPHVVIEWLANPVADAVADCCLAVVLQAERDGFPAASECAMLCEGVLRSMFTEVSREPWDNEGIKEDPEGEAGTYGLRVVDKTTGEEALVDPHKGTVSASDKGLGTAVERVIKRSQFACQPVSLS